ncbi:hypothetical protein F5883DRAFT_90780 [Diaporthe sp. PMI_573]|nr:hypothetical protein F5883DRAFT_90780 [Diaporthaceae sp. PMI_573]
MTHEMVFGVVVFLMYRTSSPTFCQPSLPTIRRLPASRILVACPLLFSQILQYEGTLRYIRGHPSSPRASLGLGGVSSSRQSHGVTGTSLSRLYGPPEKEFQA